MAWPLSPRRGLARRRPCRRRFRAISRRRFTTQTIRRAARANICRPHRRSPDHRVRLDEFHRVGNQRPESGHCADWRHARAAIHRQLHGPHHDRACAFPAGIVVPTHWDQFNVPYGFSQQHAIDRVQSFVQEVKAASPETRVIVPEHFKPIVIGRSQASIAASNHQKLIAVVTESLQPCGLDRHEDDHVWNELGDASV